MRCRYSVVLVSVSAVLVSGRLSAQTDRVFNPTADVVGIWEFNDLGVDPLVPVPDGSIVPDLSGNGLDATVEGNGAGTLVAQDGDPDFPGSTGVLRSGTQGQARVSVNEDDTAFEMDETQDFTFELYIDRADAKGTAAWGILGGTWHSRTLIDDSLDGNTDGAWYGWGFIRRGGQDGWLWVMSPVNPDGSLNSTGCCNEVRNDASWVIPPGRHYLAASVDRTDHVARVYLDGELVEEVFLSPDMSFISPTGYEPARLVFLTGVDDLTRNSFRPPPTGYTIDAARVLKRALTADDIGENWLDIQDGFSVPPGEGGIQAILSASSRDVVTGQCVRLSAENSSAGAGETITKYEWKVGDDDFEEGAATREVSFDTATGDAGVDVTLRITNSAANTATASVNILVSDPEPVAVIEARIGTVDQSGPRVGLRLDDTLTLDARSSFAIVPAGARLCPLADDEPVPPPDIEEFRWDLDSDGTDDNLLPMLDLTPSEAGDSTITLTVATPSGREASTSIDLRVIDASLFDPAPEGRVFLETDDTAGLWEFNDLGVGILEAVPNATVIPDLSGNGLDAEVEGNDVVEIVAAEGDPDFSAANTACRRDAAGPALIAVNDDDQAFEMGQTQDFSLELYVTRAETVGPENWGILAGTWHSRTLIDDGLDPNVNGAWYGWGFIQRGQQEGWLWVMSPVLPDGTPPVLGCCTNEQRNDDSWVIPPGSHYVVASVDRTAQLASVYLDGELVESVPMQPEWSLNTPTGYEHARLAFLNGVNDSTLGTRMIPPSGYGIDAARVQYRSLSAEEVLDNYYHIAAGVAVPPGESTGPVFHRGDNNDDGTINIADPVFLLNALFGGGPQANCQEATDINDDDTINIADPVFQLNALFGGGPQPPPPSADCGTDPAPPGLGCESSACG